MENCSEISAVSAEERITSLAEYGEVPIRFEVRSLFDVKGHDPASAELVERLVENPWVKDYDKIKGEGPTRWARRWDVSRWGMLTAYKSERRIGGCVLAYHADGLNQMEGREDVVAMWDLRVHPTCRGQGVGRMLFEAAVR